MAKIKAVIFDLDDTLYNVEQIRDSARKKSVMAMIEIGLGCSVEEGVKKLAEINEKNPIIRFRKFIEYFDCNDEEIAKAGIENYINAEFDGLKIYPEVVEVLESLRDDSFKTVLITQGSTEQQNKKIDCLNVRDYFNHIYTPNIGDKEKYFLRAVDVLGINASEILVVGDNIGEEIRIGNKLGMKTVRLLKGVYKNIEPENEFENADYKIRDLREVLEIVKRENNCKRKKNGLKVVAIGGGTGTSALLEGLKEFTSNITTIVTVTDTGRSTGIIRRELNMPAPGDIRNCLLALANSERLMYDLFQYRFENGTLEGYSFGNLFIAALTKLTGSFEKAIEEASKILKLEGKVLPSTLDNVNICAELEDGNILEQEDSIIDRHNNYVHLRSKIKRVFHKPEARVNEKVLKTIEEADLIVLSPGSLFTSIIGNLLIKGIPEAINKSKAKKVYVCNIMTQVSQTHQYKASEHIKEIIKYLKGDIDYAVLNSGKPSNELLESYRRENAFLVENDIEVIKEMGVKVIVDDLLDDVDEKKLLWEKKDLLRHNPSKIGELLVRLV